MTPQRKRASIAHFGMTPLSHETWSPFFPYSEKLVATLPGVAVDLPSTSSNGVWGWFVAAAPGRAPASEGVAARD
jgi:hypothetical protein